MKSSYRDSPAWFFAALPMLLFLLLPMAMLVGGTSPGVMLEKIGQEDVRQAIWLSLRTTLVSMAAIVVLGTPLALVVARGRFPGLGVIDAFLDLPVVLPPAAAGIALLVAFGNTSAIGGWLSSRGYPIVFTATAVVFAQVFVASPFYLRSAITAFRELDPDFELCAQVDGASRGQALWGVTFPLVAAPLLSGLLMSWARALGEFGATLLFAGNMAGRTQTMPLAIYLGFESDLQVSNTLSVILLAVALLTLMIARVVGKRSGTPL